MPKCDKHHFTIDSTAECVLVNLHSAGKVRNPELQPRAVERGFSDELETTLVGKLQAFQTKAQVECRGVNFPQFLRERDFSKVCL